LPKTCPNAAIASWTMVGNSTIAGMVGSSVTRN
jgi:hypothetical protein